MKVLSIYPGHNATVAYSENGVIKYFYTEESFNNIKNYTGFPILSLNALNQLEDISSVDYVTFPTETQMMVCTPDSNSIYEDLSTSKLRQVYDYLEYKTKLKWLFDFIRNYILVKKVTPVAWDSIEKYLKGNFNISAEKIVKNDHHLCHCLTPLIFYKGIKKLDKDYLLVSMDGAGDGLFTSIYKYNHQTHSVELISKSNYSSSIGLIYYSATKFLGMKPGEHEYKVMGLAAYVTEEKYFIHIYKKLKNLVTIDKNTLEIKTPFNTYLADRYFKEELCGERFDNIAAAVQKLTEDVVSEYISLAVNKTGIRDIMFSGGVFMNVKMNQKIIDLHVVDNAYFQPSCGDDSLVLGAIGNLYLEMNIEHKSINSMYLGREFSNEDIVKYIDVNNIKGKYNVDYIDDMEIKIATLLSEFKVVARVKGKSEWGARSLCNRAILGNASDLKTFYEVNDLIKMRDFWMPFAPAILDTWADKYIKKYDQLKSKAFDSSKYMIITCESTSLAEKHLRAAIHQKDKTLRPQIVEENDNSSLYKLLKHYEALTGMGGIMNTSYNLHGYPLATTIEQAMFTFENSGLKYLALENFLITKSS